MTAEELAHLQRRVVDLTAQHGANSLTFQLRLGEASALIALARRALELESALDFLCAEHDAVLCYTHQNGDSEMHCTESAAVLAHARYLGWTPTAKGVST